MLETANYAAKQALVDGVEVVQLTDAAHKTEVTVAPSIGNITCRMLVNGKNALWTPSENLARFQSARTIGGVPFLWPWANRIDQDAYYFEGKKYLLNFELGNYRHDANQKPIHGLVTFTPRWQVFSVEADSGAAWVASRLEFWKYPDLMAQFPFAHTVEMTYRLANGTLEVETAVHNQSAAPMPVLMGFHPYYQVHDAPRDEWRVHIGAKERMTLSPQFIPTGERTPLDLPDPLTLKGLQFDDVFTNLTSDFWVQGKNEKVAVRYGPKFTECVVYAPQGKAFICFEPMSGITNAFNLAHAGVYRGLQSVGPDGDWRESFWISTDGF